MMHTHAKARCYADGGLVQQLRRGVNRLVGNNPDALKDRGRDPDNLPPPTTTTATPGYNSGIKTKDNPAGIRFAKGGKVPGKSPTPTADNIPIMATAGEFVIKKAAVDKIGVPALEALNAIADGGGKTAQAAQKLRRPAGKSRFADGGKVARYVNHRRPKGPPAMPPPLQIGNSAPGPGTAVTEAPYRPNFTMGTPQQPPPAAPAVTDVRAKFNPDTASKEAKAYLNERAKAAAAPQAAAAPAAAPASPTAAPAATGPSLLRRGLNAVRSAAKAPLPTVARAAPVVGLGAEALDVAQVAMDPSKTGIDVATQAAEGIGKTAAAAAGAKGGAVIGAMTGPLAPIATPVLALAGGLGGYYLAGKGAEAGRKAVGVTPAAPIATAAPLPGAVNPTQPRIPIPTQPVTQPNAAGTNQAAYDKMNADLSASAAQPVAAPANVTRVGNSYSGPANIAGDITINGAQPRGGFVGGTGDGTFTAGGGAGQSATDAALFEARRAAIARGDVDSVRASYGGDFGVKVDPLIALMNNGRPMTTKKANAAAQLQRNAMDGAKTTAETDKAKLEGEATRQLLKAQTKLTTAKDAKTRLKAMEDLRALQGKYEKEFPNRFTVVPGGDEIGPDGFTVIKKPAYVIDNQSGQRVDLQQSQSLPPGLKVGAPSKQPDGTYSAMGKTVVIKGGKVTEIK